MSENVKMVETGEMGNVLWEKRMSIKYGVILLILGIMLFIGGGVLAFYTSGTVGGFSSAKRIIVKFVAVPVGILLGIAGVSSIRQEGGIAYFHEFGVRLVRGSQILWMPYEKVAEIKFSTTCVSTDNGRHIGMEFILRSQDGGKPIRIFHDYRETSEENEIAGKLMQLRDRVAAIVRNQMETDLIEGRKIKWSPKVTISLSGLEMSYNTGQSELVPWDQIFKLDLSGIAGNTIEQHKGVLGLTAFMAQSAAAGFDGVDVWVKGDAMPRMKIPMREPNFFPLLLIVENRVRQHATA